MKPWLKARTSGSRENPKGFASYRPLGWRKGVVTDVLALFAEYKADDALPVGPRTVGYALSQRENASGLRYTKATWLSGSVITPYAVPNGKVTERVLDGWATFKHVEDVVKRLRQAERLDWTWVSDGSAVAHPVSDILTAEQFADRALDPEGYAHNLRVGQPVVVELHSESAELTALLERVAIPYGVRVESGRGSSGPDLARKVAIRAWNRYFDDAPQRTLILGVGDLDVAGIQNVMRPHVEHVGAFLRGFAEKQKLADPYGVADAILDFQRVAITVEQALALAPTLPNVREAERLSLVAYGASGTDDWTRDISLLKAKVEVEALGPQRLREAVTTAIEEALDMDVLEDAREQGEVEAERVKAMRTTLGLEDS